MMRSRLSTPHRPFLDPLRVVAALEDLLHEDAWRVHDVGIDLAGLDQMLDFGNRAAGGGGHHRVEIPRRLSISEVSIGVALPRLDKREVGQQRSLEHVVAAVELARLLAFRDQRAEASWCEERRDTRAAGAN